jgi:hypothetical protein
MLRIEWEDVAGLKLVDPAMQLKVNSADLCCNRWVCPKAFEFPQYVVIDSKCQPLFGSVKQEQFASTKQIGRVDSACCRYDLTGGIRSTLSGFRSPAMAPQSEYPQVMMSLTFNAEMASSVVAWERSQNQLLFFGTDN